MSKKKYLLGIGLFALLLSFPLYIPESIIVYITLACIFAIFTMSWDFISGYTGYISLGHSFLTGTGAYMTAVLCFHYGMGVYVTIPMSIIAGVIAGTIIALPTLRLRGPYFTLLSLIMPLIAVKITLIFSGYLGGEMGLYGITPIAGSKIFYIITVILMGTVAVFFWKMSDSNFGKILKAIGMNEEAVEESGIDTAKFKVMGFLISSAVAGLGGSLYAYYLGSITNTALDVALGIEIVAASIIGGIGSIFGPLAGAFIWIGLRDIILVDLISSVYYRALILFVLSLSILMFSPRGIYNSIKDYFTEEKGGS